MFFTCTACKQNYEVPITIEDYTAWIHSGQLIQNYFPNLSIGDRELMISATCDTCFDKIYERESEGDEYYPSSY